MASPPDEIIEGTEEVVDGGDPSTSADFDPGGESIHLPDELPATPEANAPANYGDDDDDGPLEQEPAVHIREQVVDVADVSAEPAAEPTVPAPAPVTPSPISEAPEAAAPAPLATEPDQSAGGTGPKTEGGRMRETPAERIGNAADPAESRTQRSVAAPAPAPEPAPVAEAVDVADTNAVAQPESTAAVPVTTRAATAAKGRAARGDRFHVVRPGESLWSIAADVLGDGATVPQIAREVNRLWKLNDERIGTGRPDLLFAGTRLRLR